MALGDLIIDCLVQCLGVVGGKCLEYVQKAQSEPPVQPVKVAPEYHQVTPGQGPSSALDSINRAYGSTSSSSTTRDSLRRDTYPTPSRPSPASSYRSPVEDHRVRPTSSSDPIPVGPVGSTRPSGPTTSARQTLQMEFPEEYRVKSGGPGVR